MAWRRPGDKPLSEPMMVGWSTHIYASLGLIELKSRCGQPYLNILVLLLLKLIFNSLWPSNAIWRRGSGSTLARVMACCLTTPSHYLNQCWPPINTVQWLPSGGTHRKLHSDLPGANELTVILKYMTQPYRDVISVVMPNYHRNNIPVIMR